MSDYILFIDFDGTITTEETLSGVMKMCVDPETFKEGSRKLQEGEWTLKETVTFAFDHIPSSRIDEILAYVRGVPVREGFGGLLDKMNGLDIPVVIISGGLKPYVEEKLEPYSDKITEIYSIDIDTSGQNIKLIVPDEFEGETDLLEKTSIMKNYKNKNTICVGDGLTDIGMALASGTVFARDTLAEVLAQKEIPFINWDDFNDVKEKITQFING